MISDLATRWIVLAVVVATFGTFAGSSFAKEKARPTGLSHALSQVKLFAGLTAKERTALESVATLRRCEKGERIIEQTAPLDKMFILLESPAEVRVNGKVVATLPERSLIGEIEFLDGLPASADVIVLKESPVIEIGNAALTRLMKKQPRIGYVLMSEIARLEGQRLRAVNAK